MGVSTNYYTVYGVKHKWHDAFDEAYNEVYDDSDTPFVLADGMSGEYIILGTMLFDSGDLRWMELIDNYVEIDVDKLKDLENSYRAQFTAKFPQFADLVSGPFKIMTLAHYS